MNHLLPDEIVQDDSAYGWSFTLYYIGECVRRSDSPLSMERASLLLMAMDIEALSEFGDILRPYERFRMINGTHQLWCIDNLRLEKWPAFSKLLSVRDNYFYINSDQQWMLDSDNYLDPMALRGSTSGFIDEIMATKLDLWFAMSNVELARKVTEFFGNLNDVWLSYGDLIPAMPGPDRVLRSHLMESWRDRVMIDVAFRKP